MTAATASPEVAPLVSVLSRERLIYQELLDVAAEERQAIIMGKLPALRAALQRKQDLLARLSGLEDRRISWLRRYARKHALDLQQLTLAAIIERSEAGEGQLLRRVHRQLLQRIDRLVQMDAVTKSLLEKILGSIDGSLRFLLADDGSGLTYGSQGRLQPAASRQLLQCQA